KELSIKIAQNSLSHPLNSLVAQAFAGEPPTSLKGVAERYARLLRDADKPGEASKRMHDSEWEALRRVFHDKDAPGNLPADVMPQLSTTSALMRLGPLKAQVDQLDSNHPGAPLRALGMVDSPNPHNSRVFIRGDANRLGEEAPRQFLTSLTRGNPRPFKHG